MCLLQPALITDLLLQNHEVHQLLPYCGVVSGLKEEVKAYGLSFCPSLCVQSFVARSADFSS